MIIVYAGRVVAEHVRLDGRRERSVQPLHWEGLVRKPAPESEPAPVANAEFVQNLDAYAAIVAEVA